MSINGDLIRRGITPTFSKVQLSVPLFVNQVAPGAMTTAATITVADLLKGIITGTHAAGATAAYTLPTGADLDEAWLDEVEVDRAFDLIIINLSAALADTITLTASVGITIVGQATIDSAHTDSEFPSSGIFRIRKTAADTFVAYRIA